MTAPTTSIRTSAKKKIVDLLTTALAPVQVTYGSPGPSIDRETVFVGGPIDGVVEYPTFDVVSGRKLRDDKFVLRVIIFAVVEGGSEYDAEVRAEQLFAKLEDVFATDTMLTGVAGVLSATLGPNVIGPDGQVIDQAAQAEMIAEVTIEASLS